MPLCLAIARASGYPPVAGIWTAVVGGVLTAFVSNSQLTVKGPAAGLIVVVVGAVTDLGAEFASPDTSDADRALLGYKLALGVGVTAGVIQVLFGLLRAGRLVDFFPLTPVHGMLASIGVIVVARQSYEVIGAMPAKGAGPLALLAEFPAEVGGLNPAVAAVGLASLLILFGLPLAAGRLPWLKAVPAQMVVLLVAVGLGSAPVFDLEDEHKYPFPVRAADGHPGNDESAVGPKFLVTIPDVKADPGAAFAAPDFRGLATATGLHYLLLFTLIGSLESLLSARAVELLDPWRRKTDFDRDLLAVGLANTVSSAVGGLPMISEIVRSKANIDGGARTRAANACHGLFLLGFVVLFPGLIHRIPLAALGAMLVYTGVRLARPREFVRTYKVGGEQFVVFVGTILATLATDLLVGIGAGIGLKLMFHLWNGAPLSGLLKADVDVVPEGDRAVVLVVRKSALFTNWLGLRKAIVVAAEGRDRVALDLSRARLVDHSVMEKLHELEAEFAERGKVLELIGLELLTPLSAHPLAARKGGQAAEPATAG
ncbi:MAG: SulP family inorganic anion transporter [Gemmataceae bacterium]|nr:SulP family inorganic anion transporter [Gemmataceae bacterium]